MSFTKTFKSNKVYEAAKKFASCSCPANETNNNALFSDIAGFAVSVFLCIHNPFIKRDYTRDNDLRKGSIQCFHYQLKK